MPSVVLAATNASGAAVTEATVTVDGGPLAGKLDGLAVDVDPGPHTFGFDGEGTHAETKVIIAEGAKAQRVAVVLAPGGAGGGATGLAAAAAPLESSTHVSLPLEPATRGFSFGLRLGYGISYGSIDSPPGTVSDSLGNQASGQVP